jgi:hypothetical protein
MLLAILTALIVCAVAVVALAALSMRVCTWLRLHPHTVLQWFGVVQAPGRR